MFFLIAYIAASALLLYAAYACPKSGVSQNRIFWIAALLLLFDCWICFAGGLLSIVHIPVSPGSLATVNGTAAVLLLVLRRKSHTKQAMSHSRTDLAFALSSAFVTGVIGVYRFVKGPIVFASIDPSAHLNFAKEILADGTVINAFPNLFFTSLPNAMWVDTFHVVFGEVNSVAGFIIKDLLNLWVAGVLFYFLLRAYSKDAQSSKIAFVPLIISFAYLLGYPLNNQLSGFFYLGQSVVLITLLVTLCRMMNTDMLPLKVSLPLISLLLLGLGVSYTLFVPPVYITVLIVIGQKVLKVDSTGIELTIYPDKQAKNKRFLRLLATEALVFCIPVIFTVLFMMVLTENGDAQPNIGSALTPEGGIYRNLLMDFVPFLPFTLLFMVNRYRNKSFVPLFVMTAALTIYQVLFFCLMVFGQISTYYYYKLNFTFWFIVVACAGTAMIKLYERGLRTFVSCCLAFSIFTAVLVVFGVDTRLREINPLFDSSGFGGYLSIYHTNISYLYHPPLSYDRNFLELCKRAQKLKTGGFEDNEIVSISDNFEDVFWIDSLVGERMNRAEASNRFIGSTELPSTKMGMGKIAIVNPSSKLYKANRKYIDGLERIYENGRGFIVIMPS
jgi:hypothetical protein